MINITRIAITVSFITGLGLQPALSAYVQLKSGDTLEGEILDESTSTVSVQLPSGIVVRLSRDEIDSIDEELEFAEEIQEVTDEFVENFDFSIGPGGAVRTPTPIAWEPIKVRLGRRGFKPISHYFTDYEESKDANDQPETVAPDEGSRIGEEYGQVISLEGSTKFREHKSTWLPVRLGQPLKVGDEINTLNGRLEIVAKGGALVGLYPVTRVKTGVNEVEIKRGKAWVEQRGNNTFTVQVSGLAVRLKKAIFYLEQLRTGFKLLLLEGEARFSASSDTADAGEKVHGPKSFLLGRGQALLQQPTFPASAAKDWQSWREAFPHVDTDPSSDWVPDLEIPEDQIEPLKDLETIAIALQAYHTDVGHFPAEGEDSLAHLVAHRGEPGWKGPYLEGAGTLLIDRWGTPIHYGIRSGEQEGAELAEIYSLGPDKQYQAGKGDDIGLIIEPPSN